MKNFFLRLFLIFAFILNLCILPVLSQTMNIKSVTFDNSDSFMTVNSFDNEKFIPEEKTVINFIEGENTAYFDLQPAILDGSSKNYVLNSDYINDITVKQLSKQPDIVRFTFKYNEGFNPEKISIKKLNNTIFVRFKSPVMSNYYFQEVYKENGTTDVFEKLNIGQKISTNKNILGEINSAFDNTPSKQEDTLVTNKDLILKSKYYINSLTLKGQTPIIEGVGTYTIIRPIYLTNPSRVAFDIKNAVVNPILRNREISLGGDTMKFGQFDRNTARIVINSSKPEKYIPVIYGDTQRLALLNSKVTSPLNLYSSTSDMTGVNSEKGDSNNHSMKLTFSKSLVFGLNRTSGNIELFLFNVNNYISGAIKSELRNTPFENMDFSDIKSGGVKLTIPVDEGDSTDIYLGSDGKTLRVKLHTAAQYTPKPETLTPEIVLPPVLKRKDNKKYIVIDAGHGGSDCGALRNGINEKDITLDIAKKVEKMLEKKGYVVAMTRTSDTYVSLQERVEFSEVFNPDIFVSIHVNSSNSETPYGLETHYYKENSLQLAKNIHAAMLNNINSKDRGLFKSKFYVINHTTAPAVLIETGFISNPNERAQLITESRKNATAKAIVEGIDDYFKTK